jgi:hypothetical protein
MSTEPHPHHFGRYRSIAVVDEQKLIAEGNAHDPKVDIEEPPWVLRGESAMQGPRQGLKATSGVEGMLAFFFSK